jgi:glycosyltransferase involved in cell wall biosynthesis
MPSVPATTSPCRPHGLENELSPLPASPAFSVIATVRNEREGIASFIDSLLGQSLKPAEIIIVDGESSDGSLPILQDYAARGLIRLISRPCNIAQGRNLGIAAARCDFIAATDAGCTADPRWLENLAAGFARDPMPDVVAGNYRFETRSDFELASTLATDPPDRESSEAARYYPSSRSIAFRKSAWAAVKGYPEWLYAAEDTLFNIQLRRQGFRFHFARDAIVSWRPRPTWKGLFRQHFNYARGNGRIGLGRAGYALQLRTHALAAGLALLAFVWPVLLLVAAAVLGRFAAHCLWPQARHARTVTGRRDMLWRTLLVMETVRLAGMAGFIAGWLDRRRTPLFITAQRAWMGTDTVEA